MPLAKLCFASAVMNWATRRPVEETVESGERQIAAIENEACDSKGTGDLGAILQGFRASILCLAPKLWSLAEGAGWQYDRSQLNPLATDSLPTQTPEPVTIDQL